MMSRMNRTAPATTASFVGRFLAVALFALAGIGAAWQARAQEQAPAGDPPSRVARVSDMSGQVWLYSQDDNEWIALDRNRPLTTGDRIATDNDGRAEITLGTTTLRLDAATEFEIIQLDDGIYRVHLHGGSVAARLRNAQSLAEFVLETDDGQFRVQAIGRYRFDHSDQGSDLTVYAGQAVFEGRNSALPLTTGQHAQFWLDASGAAQYNMIDPVRDAFTAWNDERDRLSDRPVAVRYVSPEMTGADDLDRYGQWQQSPDYGALWTPGDVPADWTPYSAGHWAWVRPWGWTWVDAAPWGFAPFHYGRWVNYHDRWCWAPGTYVARPVYAPALVGWIGGPRVGVSLSIGGGGPPVGWFPLAPHEVYVPSYRTSPRYVREVNITHVTNITNITTIVNNVNGAADRREFANRKFPNAVTVVPAGVFTGRQAVGPAAAQLRGNPQVRALVADGRAGPAMNAAPVATPPARPRLAEGQAPPVRPPFEGRAPGLAGARPTRPEARAPIDPRRPSEIRSGERVVPGSNAVGGATPAVGGGNPGRTIPPAPIGRAPQSPAAPDAARTDAVRPGQVQRGNAPDAIARPPVPGRVLREPGGDNVAPRTAPPSLQRNDPTPGHLGDPRGADPQRQMPSRPTEQARPAELPRAVEAPRAVDPARAAEPARLVPDQRVQRPEAPRRDDRHDEKREDKRDDKRDPKDAPK